MTPTRLMYIGAVVAAAAAVVITWLVPALAERSTFLAALGVVFFIAGTWGWRAGAFAAVTSFVLITWLMPPSGGWFSRTGRDGLRFATFALLTGAALFFARAKEQAEARLRRSYEEKERFIAVVAHELRTPLNAAMGWLHIMRTGEPAQAVARAGETVQRNLQMMHALIEDIVDFNRTEYGKLTLNRVRLDPAQVVSDVVMSARTIAQQRRIFLRCELQDGLPEIDADNKRVRQVLLNVITNALKFTPAGGQVFVHGYVADAGLVIVVADNGPGIGREQLRNIFDPLQRGGGERSDGLGLGLALVKRLTEAHGGTVRVDSEPERGTTVTLTLPIAGTVPADVAV